MVVQLTREQYEKLYGSKPVFTGTDSTFEATPIRMTQDEYNKLYPKQEYQPPRGLGIKETALAGLENIKTGLQKTFGAGEAVKPKDNIFDEGIARGTLETLFRGLRAGTESVVGLGKTVGGIAQFGLAPMLGPLNIVGEKIGTTIGRSLPTVAGSSAESISNNPIATQALSDILDLANLAVPEAGARGVKALEPVQKAIEIKLQSGELTPPQVKTFIENRVASQALNDLQELKTKNAKLRNNPFFDDASLNRIADAQAKTGFLNNATDYDGTIRTKDTGIAEKYRELTIDGADGVVRQLLKREGATVNINEISNAMRVAADLKYEGADLVNAIRAIKKELEGLSKRADEFGNIPLDKVQDMKIASTQYVDYTKPAAASFKKLKGSVYRQIIEDKSSATIEVGGKQRTIKDINAELQKYYRDIENLEALDGLKVKGARLGKYFSQTLGAIIGSSAGQIAGPFGSAVGGILGAEAGGALRGAQLARSFGRGRAGELPANSILQKAKEVGKSESIVDLRKPDVRIGAPANIPKTKEIRIVEAQITKNVEAQKKAIAEKNFTLVATLKDVYKALVEKLKNLIEKVSTGTVRGFARMDLGQSKSEGSRKSIQANTNGKTSSSTVVNDTTSFPGIPKELQPLAEEAKKYKSAEEFVKSKAIENSKQYNDTAFTKYLNDTYDEFSSKKQSILKSAKSLDPNIEDVRLGGSYGRGKPTPESDIDLEFTYKGTPPENLYEKLAGQYQIGEGLADAGVVPNTTKSQLTDLWNKVQGGTPQAFEGFTDLSTKLLEKLKGRTTVSKQFISDLTNSPDLKQPERDLIRNLLEGEGKDVSVPDFANKVKSELLPLKRGEAGSGYENITLPAELRGPVSEYSTHTYESPITTSAGRIHPLLGGHPLLGESNNYFAHTRIEDLPAKDTRRVIELQSDLFQKGRLDKEGLGGNYVEDVIKLGRKYGVTNINDLSGTKKVDFESKLNALKKQYKEQSGVAKLEPYRNTWHERVIREEVKQAAKDGKTKLQFPTGETAMKIEGLGERSNWTTPRSIGADGLTIPTRKLTTEDLKVGNEVWQGANRNDNWIITDVLGDGKFKAVPKDIYEENGGQMLRGVEETFDISGKVDTNNPIYKFYEKEVGKYLKNKYGAELVTDPQGVKWWEVKVTPEMKKLPIEAFGAAALPALPAIVQTDKGNDVTPVPKEWKSEIDKQYKAHPALQKYPGLLEAVLMQESSMGRNDANYNPDIGESAWLVGFTKEAKKELESKGIPVNLDTQAGVIKAMADYLDLKSTVVQENGDKVVYKDPVRLYNQRYKTKAGINLKAEDLAKFRDYISFYQ